MFRRLLAVWETQHTKPVRPARRLRLEALEAREVPTVSLATIPDQQIATNAPTYLPVTVANTPNGTVSYDVTSSDAAVTPSVVQGGRSVRFTVAGKNTDGTDFSGDIVIRLFEDAAPLTTARLIQLVNQGFYVNKLFHRVEKTFGGVDESIIQGGSLNGDGTGGSGLGELPDEYNSQFRFNSPGIVASANRGDDTTDNQFFIDRPTTALANRPQFLNFNYTVFGILTAGGDVYEKVRNTPLSGTRPVSNVTITKAEVFADTANAVLKVVAQSGYTGSAKLTVTPRDTDGASAAVTSTLTGTTANPATGNPPFLGAIPSSLTTAAGDPVTFSLPYTDVDNSPVTFEVRDSTFSTAPANVTVSVNQSAGTVTLTPAPGFTGVINLKVGVRDNVDRSGTGQLSQASNFDTQALTLTVNAAVTVPQATVSLSANPATVTAGGSVTLSAGVTAAGVSSPAGTVEFRNGGTLLGTVAVSGGSATSSQTFATAGTQTLTATFVPADSTVVRGNTSSAVTVSVTAAPVPGAAATTTVLSVSPAAPTAGQATTLTVTVAGGSQAFTGSVQFFADGASLGSTAVTAAAGSGTATLTNTFATAGTRLLTATFTPADATVVSSSTSAAVSAVVAPASTTQPPISPSNGITARGSAAGSPPRVTVFNADGTQRVQFLAFEESFTGGVRTAVADVTGDGTPDIVVVPAYGGAPLIKVFDSTTGELVASKMVFEDSFRGGLTLATGDTNGLGYARVLVGAGETGAPRVTLYDFKTTATVLNYYAYDSSLRGGVSVSIGSLPGGTGSDIVTGVGAGGGPQVNVYDGATGTLLGSTQTGDTADRRGVGVRVGTSPSNPTANTIFVNRKFGSAGTTEDPLTDLGFIKFDAARTAAQQQQVQQILTGAGSSPVTV